MKKVVLSLVVTGLLFSCSKKEDLNQKNDQPVQSTSEINNDNSSGSNTEKSTSGDPTITKVRKSNFQDEMHAIMHLGQKDEFENNAVDITYSKSDQIFTITYYENGEQWREWNQDPLPPAIVCEGGGVSFVNCVAGYLEANPECCVLVCEYEGNYTAQSDC